jgi:hypothetical protein
VPVVRFYVDDVTPLLEPTEAGAPGLHVRISLGSERGTFYASDVSSVSGYVEVPAFELDVESEDGRVYGRRCIDMLRAWYGDEDPLPSGVFVECDGEAAPAYALLNSRTGNGGHPAMIALRVLLSKYGAASSAYDLLPGVAPAEGVAEIRAGCGLTTDDVDVASWLAALSAAPAVPSRGLVLAAPISVGELLSRHICPVLGGYWMVTRAGKIAFRRYAPATPATVTGFAITDANNIGGDNVVDDEQSVLSRVVINVPKRNAKHVVHYVENEAIYGRLGTEIEIDSALSMPRFQDVLSVAERLFARFGRGALRFSVRCPWSAHTLEPGDVVTITSTRVPSHTSSALGVTAQPCEVVRVAPDLERGDVRLELLSTYSAKLIAPCFEITGGHVNGVWPVALLYGQDGQTVATEMRGYGDLTVGWNVRLLRPLTGLLVGGDDAKIGTVVDGTHISIEDAPEGLTTGDVGIMYVSAVSDLVASYSSAEPSDFAEIAAAGSITGDRWA